MLSDQRILFEISLLVLSTVMSVPLHYSYHILSCGKECSQILFAGIREHFVSVHIII